MDWKKHVEVRKHFFKISVYKKSSHLIDFIKRYKIFKQLLKSKKVDNLKKGRYIWKIVNGTLLWDFFEHLLKSVMMNLNFSYFEKNNNSIQLLV